MKAITATWKNGQILPDEPVDWPEGSRLAIEPLHSENAVGLTEADWSNSPDAIADWLKWYESLEPLDFTPEEEAELASWRRRIKEYTIANIGRNMEGQFE